MTFRTMKNNDWKEKKDRLKDFILKWNVDFPIDRWWRNKHGVPFNSPAHREISFLDQYHEYIEDKMYEELSKKHGDDNVYKPGSGNFLDAPDISAMSIEDLKKEALNKLRQFKK